MEQATGERTDARRPRRGEQLEVVIERSPTGARRRRADRLRGLRRRRLPGDACGPRSDAKSDSPTRAPSRSSIRALTGSRPVRPRRRLPRLPLAGPALRAPAPDKHEQVEDALSRIGGLEGFDLEPIVPADEQWRYRNKIEYTFGDRRGRAPGFHARGRWDVSTMRGLLARVRAQQRGAQRGARLGPRGGCLRPPPQNGVLRNLVVREGRSTGDQTRLAHRSEPATRTRPSSSTPIEGPAAARCDRRPR